MRDQKKKPDYLKLTYYTLAILIVLLVVYGISIFTKDAEKINDQISSAENSEIFEEEPIEIEYQTEPPVYPDIEYPDNTGNIKQFGVDITSKSAVLIDITDNKIIAGRDGEKRIYPASMTKIMTLIVAVENMTSEDDTFTMTEELISPLVEAEASRVGFAPGETVTMRDMLYGAILPSGADATVGLAVKISGSEEEFVKLMNEKAESIGLKNTHFCNTSGLHDEQHYSTPVEMAMILEYAVMNDTCREILSTYQYTTSRTFQHPKGINISSTLFDGMYGDEVDGAQIIAGKTGYTDEALNCLATYGKKAGKEYITVCALTPGFWNTVYDAFNIYASYIEPKTEINVRPE